MKKIFAVKICCILLLGVALIALELWYGRIAQPLAYHHFADHRTFLGIHNFLNVISNLIFFVIGLYALIGLFKTRKKPILFAAPSEIIFYAIFFLGVFLVSFGSSYYHLSPNNNTLIWDRLPMTVAFMSFFSAVVAQRISLKWGLILLPIAIVLGILSVMYWQWTMQAGVGDLRFYIFIQFYPVFAIPLIFILFKPEYSHNTWLWVALTMYIIAKIFEIFDLKIFLFTGDLVSGHSLKHIAAALSCLCVWLYLANRTQRTASDVKKA